MNRYRLAALLALATIIVWLVCQKHGIAQTGPEKAAKAAKAPVAPTKATSTKAGPDVPSAAPTVYRGRVPTGWTRLLGIGKDQAARIRELDSQQRAELEVLKSRHRKALVDLLTPEQKKRLTQHTLGE